MTQIQQIESVISKSTETEKENGMSWYQEAHQYADQLSKEFNVTLEIACAIIAVLSPMKRWDLNKRIAKQFLEGKRNVHTRLQTMKGEAILRGEDIELCLGGLKTINFYHNILNPKEDQWITIDRHIIYMFGARPTLSPKQYQKLKKPFVEYSKDKELVGCQYQAICWLYIINTKNGNNIN